MATLRKEFREKMGYELNLDDPRTLSEKIQWLKIHYRDPFMAKCADKVAVRDYVAKMLGQEYLVPIYGIWEHVNDVNTEALPQKFVLKTSHASGQVIICSDKNQIDWEDTLRKLQRWQHKNYYYTSGEWVYKDIKPRIICEKLLDENITDYKIQCFNGAPKILYVCVNRATQLQVSHFDLNFNILHTEQIKDTENVEIQKPQCFDKMLKIAQTMAVGFPYVRVDLYESRGKVYFGELTFSPANGMRPYEPAKWDVIMGDLLDLSKVDKKYVI
jgi:hypothetical protein